MSLKRCVAGIAAVALSVLAASAEELAAKPDKADMQKHFVQMCADGNARAAGEMAYLETKLALSEKQKPLFDRWKAVRLASAKSHAAECAAMLPPDAPPSGVDRLKMEEKILRARLADVKAELPSFEALYASLTPDQSKVLDGLGHRGPGPRLMVRHEDRDGGPPDAPMPPPDGPRPPDGPATAFH